MDKETQSAKIREFAASIAPDIKTEQDLANLTRELVKQTVEMALSRELDVHLGYTKHSPSGHNTGNSRNGTSHKTLQSEKGRIKIQTPRDRKGSFEPQLIKKGQTHLTLLDEQILSLYARGMTTRDISAAIQEMYGAEVSPTIVSQVTEAVYEQVITWQNRPLETLYPIVHMVRNSLKYVSWRDRKAVAADLKDIYQSISEEEAGLNLKEFMEKWDD